MPRDHFVVFKFFHGSLISSLAFVFDCSIREATKVSDALFSAIRLENNT